MSSQLLDHFSGPGPAVQNRFVNALRVMTSAVSFAHDEALIVHVVPDTLRLAVGLEDPADLIADIRPAIDTALPA